MSDCRICGDRLDEDNHSSYCSRSSCRKAEEHANKSYRAEATTYRQNKKLQAKYDALKASRTKLITELRRLQRSTTSDKDFRYIEKVIIEAEKII